MATPARGAPGTAVVPKEGMPNQTLYCRNLPDKMHKDDLKQNLHMLFSTYGPVIDIVALKTMKMRGQAHIAMRDVDTATQAMRALQGFSFFGKEMQIAYAKGKSDTIAKLDGTYKMPEVEREAKEGQEDAPAQTSGFGAAPAKAVPVNAAEVAKGQKRAREEEEEEDDAEMEMDVSDEDSD